MQIKYVLDRYIFVLGNFILSRTYYHGHNIWTPLRKITLMHVIFQIFFQSGFGEKCMFNHVMINVYEHTDQTNELYIYYCFSPLYFHIFLICNINFLKFKRGGGANYTHPTPQPPSGSTNVYNMPCQLSGKKLSYSLMMGHSGWFHYGIFSLYPVPVVLGLPDPRVTGIKPPWNQHGLRCFIHFLMSTLQCIFMLTTVQSCEKLKSFMYSYL